MAQMGGNGLGGARRFSARAVIRSAVAITWHNLFRFVGIVLAIALPALVLSALARMVLLSAVTPGPGGAIDLTNNGSAVLFLVVASVLGMLVYLLTQAAIVFGTLEAMRGGSAGIGRCLSQALAHLSRLFPAGLLLFFGGGALAGIVGFFIVQIFGKAPAGAAPQDLRTALVVFSLAVMVVAFAVFTLVWVFVPVIVVERAGPIAGFRRSFALTKGRRWPVAGIVLLLFFANVAVSALTRWLIENGAPLGGTALNVVAGLFFMVLAAVLSAVGYVHLRAEKEGTAADARVFD
jgi:hypothetical protein